MKIFTIMFFLLLFTKVYANTWAAPIMTCSEGKLEKICWGSWGNTDCRTQFLVTNHHVKNFFKDHYLIRYTNWNDEAIFPNLQSIPNSSDYIDEHDAYQGQDGRVFYIKPYSDSLTIESFRTYQVDGHHYVKAEMVGNYVFHGCYYH